MPSGRAILLGRPEETVQAGTKAELAAQEGGVGGAWMRATRPGETDHESHALGKFFGMLRGGQMMAVEMLFVPQDQVLASDPIWDEVRRQRDRLLCRKASSFAGHARKQAEIYGRKAQRLGEVETAHRTLTALIARYGEGATLGAVHPEIEALVAGRKHLAVVPQDSGYTAGLPHLVVADRKIAYTLSLTAAHRSSTPACEPMEPAPERRSTVTTGSRSRTQSGSDTRPSNCCRREPSRSRVRKPIS